MSDTDLTRHGPGHLPPGRISTVALYATDPDADTVKELLARTAVLADRRGWLVPDGCTITDRCPLKTRPQSRPGWDRLRSLAEQRRIHGLVVPATGHFGFTWSVWAAERRYLHRHGVFVASVEPILGAVLEGAAT
ncbi:hypothetical protein [Streptomyces sp. NPDC056527]|uniref:hypothetical protein n=1 Tax=Streptomyces sp. NPDC056527 TaxID=3345853 RepID=UPI0036C65657